MQNTTLNLYPTISSSTATTSTADLQHQLYLSMKSNSQDQAVDLELWDILKAKFEKSVNLTAPTLTFPGIEAHDPLSIVDKPSTGLIYLNNKEEKRVMYLAEILMFFDATLERVLNEVKLKIFNYLLKVDTHLLTHDILGFKTYEENKNAWIHKWNEDVPWVPEESYMVYFQDNEWYEALEDGTDANSNPYLNISQIFNNHEEKNKVETIKDEKELMDDYDMGNLDDHLISNNAPYYEEEKQYKEKRCELLWNPQENPPTCKIERFKVINYSFGPAEGFVAINECGYDD
ncbi:hypothetical protein Tco_0890622 [Tanacetum coccineum]|uniref:Uncharacterized protein n=1 Tax=Tanacetum coccineum TaxID=301880 RepID=A0ABQ5C0L5_9ASTR